MNEVIEETQADENFDLEELHCEENWLEEGEPHPSGVRRRAIILLIALLLPAALILIEVLTGGAAPLIHSSKTAIPRLLPAVRF